MNKYTKPTAQVVELSVKESISLITKEEPRNFGFGSAAMTLKTYAANVTSIVTSITKS